MCSNRAADIQVVIIEHSNVMDVILRCRRVGGQSRHCQSTEVTLTDTCFSSSPPPIDPQTILRASIAVENVAWNFAQEWRSKSRADLPAGAVIAVVALWVTRTISIHLTQHTHKAHFSSICGLETMTLFSGTQVSLTDRAYRDGA